VALTAYEVAAGTYDLVPVAEGWSTNMARQLKPCMVFVPTKMMETKETWRIWLQDTITGTSA